ncbi:MAG: carboxypeptidase-like regulatory domain-containing protein [Vulcanimicrobiota bacterium]
MRRGAFGLVLLSGMTSAQPDPRGLGTVPNFEDIRQPPGLRFVNAFIHHQEWGLGQEQLLSVANAYSLLQPGRPLDAFLAQWHQKDQDFALGSQLLNNATPIYEQFLFQGGRWGWQRGAWSGGLFFGQSQNALQELRGTFERQQVAGASVGWSPDDFHAYGLTLMPYASQAYGGIDRYLAMAQVYQAQEFRDGGGYGLSAGYGRDSASGDSAFRVLGGFHSPWLDLDLSTRSIGSRFGPSTGFFDLRGTSFSSLTGTIRLSPEWSVQESASLSDTFMNTAQAAHIASWNHSLRYQTKDLAVSAGVQQLSQVAQGFSSSSNSYYLNAYAQWDQLRLNTILRHTVGNYQNDELGLGLTFPMNDWLSVRLQEFYNSGGALASNAGLIFNLGQYGTADLGYYRQDQLQNTVFRQANRDSLVANAQLNLLGNLKLRASINPQSFSLAQLRWVADEHQEFTLEHRFQNPQNRFFYDDFTSVPLGHVTTLSWNASWGGPLETRLRGELESRARVRVLTEEGRAVEGARLRLGDREAVTGRDGLAFFGKLPAGPSELKVSQLPENYELVGSGVEALEVEPGRTAERDFLTTAHSGLELIVFQDPEAEGKILGADYTPAAPTRIWVNDQAYLSDQDGKVRLHRLAAGQVRIRVDPSSLQAGMELTTAAEQTADLETGKTRRIEMGLRGFGELALQVLEYRPGAWSPQGAVPAANVGLLNNRRPIGRTDSSGRFQGRVPAGRSLLEVDLGGTGGRLVSEIPVNQSSRATLIFYRLARLHLSFQGLPADTVLGVSLEGPDGVVMGPTYVGQAGHDFVRLSPGNYQLRLEKQTLPEHFSTEQMTVPIKIGSGQSDSLLVKFKEVRP